MKFLLTARRKQNERRSTVGDDEKERSTVKSRDLFDAGIHGEAPIGPDGQLPPELEQEMPEELRGSD